MKRSQLILATLSLPLDYIMLIAAGLLAYRLRFESFVTDIRPIIFYLPIEHYLPKLALMAAAWLALFALIGLYRIGQQIKLSREVGKIFLACTAGLALIIILFFFNPSLFASRFIVLAGWGLAIVLVSLGRLLLRFIRTALYKRGYAVSQVLLIGADATTAALNNLFALSPHLGIRVVAQLDKPETSLITNYPNIDEVIIGDPNIEHSRNLVVLNYCLTHHLGFRYVADMFDAQSHNVVVHTLAGVPLIEIKRTPLDGWGRVVKRILDIILAGLLLLILSPALLLVALVIMIDSGWPIIVVLTRIGEKRTEFKLYKFRSMVRAADKLKTTLLPYNERADGPLFKMTNDPRVTRVGKFLRRWSIDELPQLWNVVRGEMSLVGPRPHEPGEVARYQPTDLKLLNIKPGVTGLAQISGRSNLSFADEVKLDNYYIENWSIAPDIIIIIKTIIVILQRKNAS